MRRMNRAFVTLWAVVLVSLLMAGASIAEDTEATPAEATIAATFSLTDLAGKSHRLESSPDTGVWAFVFLSTECPIARGYIPELNRIFDAVSAKPGVRIFGVISDPSVTRDDARKFAEEFAIRFPVLFDASGELATQLKPTHVPEAFVLDDALRLAYRGRIDDIYPQIGKRRQQASEHNLQDAIVALAEGKPIDVNFTKPVGCLFESWEERGTKRKITYNRDIAPIVQNNCLVCHREGEVGPFPLASYEDVSKRAEQLAAVTTSRQMPPWMPAAGHEHFIGERRLTDFEIKLIDEWAKSGAAEGNIADLPPAPEFYPGWRLGEPDLIVSMPESFDVPAEGADIFQNFVIPIDVPEDKVVAAVDVQAGCKSVVHHVVLFLDSNGKARALDAKTPEQGYSSFGGPGFLPTGSIGGWSPGSSAKRLRGDMGRYLKKGSDLVMQVHYHPSGKAERDQTKVGIYFVEKPKNIVAGIWAANYQMDIPAGEKEYSLSADHAVPDDILLVAVWPHMHLIGKQMTATAHLPDGTSKVLVSIDNWDFNWQDEYQYQEPIALPKGTRLHVDAVYDNSAANPANPNQPPKRVTFGEATTDEMFYCFFIVAAKEPKKLVPVIFDNLRKDITQPRPRISK